MNRDPKRKKGTLKIFLGYGICSGKTCAMINAAKEAKKLGQDVVIGYTCFYSLEEASIIEDIELLFPNSISCKGERRVSFDIEYAIKRKPNILVLDEMSHKNEFGERHKYRYQDILELIDSGISVYTTLNIGELESYHDIISSIASSAIKETVPDFIFDNAQEVEFVDIEPKKLLCRIHQHTNLKKESKKDIYTIDALTSLRKLAYRRCEDKADKTLREEKSNALNNKYYFEEHILVCISSAPSNAKVIRTAARIANAFHGTFTAIYVQTSSKQFRKERNESVNENIKLAKQLGAKIVTTYGDDIAYQISEYARINGVSKIVLGKTAVKRSIFQVKQSLVEKINIAAPDIDVYIIPDLKSSTKQQVEKDFSWDIPTIKDIGKTIAVLAGATLIGALLHCYDLGNANIIIGYLIATFFIAATTRGSICGILSAMLSIFLYRNMFLHITSFGYVENRKIIITSIVILAVAILVNRYKSRLKEQSEQVVNTSLRTEVLFNTSKMLRQKANIEEVIEGTAEQLKGLLQCSIICYTKFDEEIVGPKVYPYENETIDTWDSATQIYEQKTVEWVFDNRHVAGYFTDTFSLAKAMYFPMYNNEKVFAVIGILLERRKQLDSFEKNIIKAVLTEVGFVIEKIVLNEMQEEILIQTEKEKLRSNLLRSISHDLRTPLAGITGSASFLLESYELLDKESKESLIKEILKDSTWMSQLVDNLLNMTRIQEGKLLLKRELEVVDDIISEAISRIRSRLGKREINVSMPEELLLIPMDGQLIIQVIVNLLDNAIKHTKEDGQIYIKVYKIENSDCNTYGKFEIIDDGNGIEEDILETMFECFVTEQKGVTDSSRGIGLGLSICKSIIQAHRGEIGAFNNRKGATFYFMLPIEGISKENE